jgi:hypothetical protein
VNRAFAALVVLGACSHHRLGVLPDDAALGFASLCADYDGSKLEVDDGLDRTKRTLPGRSYDGLEAVRCSGDSSGVMVFDHATHELVAFVMQVRDSQLDAVERLLAPVMTETQRDGFRYLRMAVHASWNHVPLARTRWDDASGMTFAMARLDWDTPGPGVLLIQIGPTAAK